MNQVEIYHVTSYHSATQSSTTYAISALVFSLHESNAIMFSSIIKHLEKRRYEKGLSGKKVQKLHRHIKQKEFQTNKPAIRIHRIPNFENHLDQPTSAISQTLLRSGSRHSLGAKVRCKQNPDQKEITPGTVK